MLYLQYESNPNGVTFLKNESGGAKSAPLFCFRGAGSRAVLHFVCFVTIFVCKVIFMNKLPLLIAAVCSCSMLNAQILARQYFSMPQKVSPAMTGFIPGDVRVTAGNHMPSSYWVMQYAADASLLKGRLPAGDVLGVGISYEEAGFIYKMKERGAGLALAYHKAMGRKRNKYLSAGVQQLTNIWRMEGAGHMTFPTYSAGLMFTTPLASNLTAYAGYASYIRREPRDMPPGFTMMPSGYTFDNIYAGVAWTASSRFSLYASGLVTDGSRYQGSAIGEYVLRKDSKKRLAVAAGAMYYHRQTISPYIGVVSPQARFGLSYQVATESSYLFPRRVEASAAVLLHLRRQDGAVRTTHYPQRLF